MRNQDTGLAYDILRSIQNDSQASTTIADETFTRPSNVVEAIAKWEKTDILYRDGDSLYLTEKGRTQLGLYVRPKQAV